MQFTRLNFEKNLFLLELQQQGTWCMSPPAFPIYRLKSLPILLFQTAEAEPGGMESICEHLFSSAATDTQFDLGLVFDWAVLTCDYVLILWL